MEIFFLMSNFVVVQIVSWIKSLKYGDTEQNSCSSVSCLLSLSLFYCNYVKYLFISSPSRQWYSRSVFSYSVDTGNLCLSSCVVWHIPFCVPADDLLLKNVSRQKEKETGLLPSRVMYLSYEKIEKNLSLYNVYNWIKRV